MPTFGGICRHHEGDGDDSKSCHARSVHACHPLLFLSAGISTAGEANDRLSCMVAMLRMRSSRRLTHTRPERVKAFVPARSYGANLARAFSASSSGDVSTVACQCSRSKYVTSER